MPQFRPSCKGHNHLISRGKDSGGMEKILLTEAAERSKKWGGGRRLGVGMNGGGGRCV